MRNDFKAGKQSLCFVAQAINVHEQNARIEIIVHVDKTVAAQRKIFLHAFDAFDFAEHFGHGGKNFFAEVNAPKFGNVQVDDNVRVKVNDFVAVENFSNQQAIKRADGQTHID